MVKKCMVNDEDDGFKALSSTPIPSAMQRYSKQGCELCLSHILLYDIYRAELVCPRCGLVVENMDESVFDDCDGHSCQFMYTGTGYTFSEKEFMRQNNLHMNTFKDAKERRYYAYNKLLLVFKCRMRLSYNDMSDVWNIIRGVDTLKDFHRREGYEVILLALCRYVYELSYHDSSILSWKFDLYEYYGLTSHKYEIIKKNIRRI